MPFDVFFLSFWSGHQLHFCALFPAAHRPGALSCSQRRHQVTETEPVLNGGPPVAAGAARQSIWAHRRRECWDVALSRQGTLAPLSPPAARDARHCENFKWDEGEAAKGLALFWCSALCRPSPTMFSCWELTKGCCHSPVGTARHSTALHFTSQHCTALYCTALHVMYQDFIALLCTARDSMSLHCIACYCTLLHFRALRCLSRHGIKLINVAVYCLSLHSTMLHFTSHHSTALQGRAGQGRACHCTALPCPVPNCMSHHGTALHSPAAALHLIELWNHGCCFRHTSTQGLTS